MKMDIQESIEIPEGITATYENGILTVKGSSGEVQRKLRQPRISIAVKDGSIVFEAKQATQREKRHIFTLKSHAKNMLRGAAEGHTYRLKVCSGHFPMNVSVSGQKLVVKNFLGEAVPRELDLKHGPQVKVDGDIITVSGVDKELTGQVAADIEQLTRITGRDRRIFQDGLYIIEKDGKVL